GVHLAHPRPVGENAAKSRQRPQAFFVHERQLGFAQRIVAETNSQGIQDGVARGVALLDRRGVDRPQLFLVHFHYVGSQVNTSLVRSSGVRDEPNVPFTDSSDSAVQPSARWMERIGRGWLNRKISFLRTPKICPVMPAARSEQSHTTSGATFSGVICCKRST